MAAASLGALEASLRLLCPVATPDMLPHEQSAVESYPTLLGRGSEDEAMIARLVDDATGPDSPVGRCQIVPRWRADAERMRFVLESCVLVPASEASVLRTRHTLAQLAAFQADDTLAEKASSQLAALNGIEHASAIEGRVWMQEAFSVAYAMKVVASNMGSWTYCVGPAEPALADDAPNAERLRALLVPATKQKARAAAEQKAGGSAKREAGSLAKRRERVPAEAEAQSVTPRKKAAKGR